MHMLFGFVLIPVAVNILYICKCVALVVYPRNGTERERGGSLLGLLICPASSSPRSSFSAEFGRSWPKQNACRTPWPN